MKDESNPQIGKTYYPRRHANGENEIIGSYWRAWIEGEKYFYEFDSGHFATAFKVVEISKEDYLLIKNGKINNLDIERKYAR